MVLHVYYFVENVWQRLFINQVLVDPLISFKDVKTTYPTLTLRIKHATACYWGKVDLLSSSIFHLRHLCSLLTDRLMPLFEVFYTSDVLVTFLSDAFYWQREW